MKTFSQVVLSRIVACTSPQVISTSVSVVFGGYCRVIPVHFKCMHYIHFNKERKARNLKLVSVTLNTSKGGVPASSGIYMLLVFLIQMSGFCSVWRKFK